jgi:phospholipid/cholesterol/gamma-HCH transport system substrate-binding protein
MAAKREQIMVVGFVAVAVGILLFTMMYIDGVFRGNGHLYRGYFKNASGVQKGGVVRYAGGPPIGRITDVQPDPQDMSRMKVEFRVEPSVPVKTDSKVKIAALSQLGEYFVAILPGSPSAAMAENGATLETAKFSTFDDMASNLTGLRPKAQKEMDDLTATANKLKTTIGHLNTQLNAQNRKKISNTAAHANDLLAKNRRDMPAQLNRMNEMTVKIDRSIDDLKTKLKKTDDAITRTDNLILKEQPKLEASLQKLQNNLDYIAPKVDHFDRKLSNDSVNIDEMIENLRQLSENLKALSESVKTQPNILIRSPEPKPRRTGEIPK